MLDNSLEWSEHALATEAHDMLRVYMFGMFGNPLAFGKSKRFRQTARQRNSSENSP
jgi:hypothetical protein